MSNEESNDRGSGENNRARACDTCQSAACTVYCQADSAYLCTSCDTQVHSANRVASRHERVQVCESCERVPAAFLCKADNASLCSACDSEVHSANPLARRHQRVPIQPISGNSCSSMVTHQQRATTESNPENRLVVSKEVVGEDDNEDDRVAASWLCPDSEKNSDNNNNQNNEYLYGEQYYLDLVDYNSSMDYKSTSQYNQQQQDCGVPQTSYGGDGVVPLQFEESRAPLRHEQQNFQFDITYGSSGNHYSYYDSLNHNARILSMETGVVPEPTAPHPRTPKATIDQLPGPIQMKTQLSPMDREGRLLRYREKKKTRKFEKTIRYASRKAYAERRPRINGRFAKRRETEAENQALCTTQISETGYGIVPSFNF